MPFKIIPFKIESFRKPMLGLSVRELLGVLCWALAVAVVPLTPVFAHEEEPAEELPEPDWNFELGLSYLATSGNSDTSSGGFKAALVKDWDPWSLEAQAFYLRAEDEDETTVDRYGAGLSGARALNERWSLTAGWSGEKDRFSGIDFRSVLNFGIKWATVTSKRWTLESLAALTWTSESFDGDLPSNDYLGASVGVKSAWKLSESADLSTKMVYFPNFDESEDYRFEGDLALTASLSSSWALALGYQVRYDNLPVPGFEKTDTATTASLVLKLPNAGK